MASSSHDIPDLEEIVLRWAKQMFEATKNREQSKIDKNFLQFNINWHYVKFEQGDPQYDIIPLIKGNPKKNKEKMAVGGPKAPVVQPQVLFKTVFRNRTKQDQEYSFKTERTTRSAATICIERGFSRGCEFNFGLKAPEEIAEANVGFKREMNLTNIGEDTVEEEITWGVDNLVRVPPNTETTAELVITEAQCRGSFKMLTKFYGRVICTVTNLRENNELVTIIEGNIKDILQHELARGLTGFSVQGGRVHVETWGTANFKYGLEQSIQLSERPLAQASAPLAEDEE